ncbi:hypothetical protein ACWEQC_22155 [Streptomyces shenzhenensis]
MLRSACTCDDAAPIAPEIVGWIDPASGVFTPGPAPAGAGPCGVDDCATVNLLRLCDQTPGGDCVPFLRHLVHDCGGGVAASTDTTLDGTTPYTPTGIVGDCTDCDECRPVQLCPQLLGISGPDSWTMPDGTESLAVTVACGPVTITDCAGSTTVVNECGTSFQWSAPPGDCQPGSLCTPFTVDLPEGAAVYINFLSPCDQGDES